MSHCCSICQRSFTRKGDRNRHEIIHENKKPFECEYCSKTFAQRSALNTHLNTHTRKRPHVCKINGCKASFGDPSSCARHRKEKHNTTPPFICPVADCKTRIKRKSTFKKHLEKKHDYDTSAMFPSLSRVLVQRSMLEDSSLLTIDDEEPSFPAEPTLLLDMPLPGPSSTLCYEYDTPPHEIILSSQYNFGLDFAEVERSLPFFSPPYLSASPASSSSWSSSSPSPWSTPEPVTPPELLSSLEHGMPMQPMALLDELWPGFGGQLWPAI